MTTDAQPQPWKSIMTAPKDGTLMDILFDPKTAASDSKGSLAEFYAPGCTRRRKPTEPMVANVAYGNGDFRPVVDAEGARAMLALGGGWGHVDGVSYALLSIRPTHWRPAATPFPEAT